MKTFEKPLELTNNPIYADNFDKYFMEGDSTTLDEGNGNADDFFNAPRGERAQQFLNKILH